jgi:hypothetical protein
MTAPATAAPNAAIQKETTLIRAPLLLLPPGVLDPPLFPLVLPDGAVGTNVPLGAFARQELAAAEAAALEAGPLGLTVALPAKLQVSGLRLFNS